MRILIDGDGCPVVPETVRIAGVYGVPCVILCDTNHVYELPGAETIVCDQGADSVDYTLCNLLHAGDVAVTQDYGLAALCLSRGAIALSQDGLVYSSENIDGLLEARALAAKIRRGGGRLKGPGKRTIGQDTAFSAALCRILEASCGNH